MATAQTDSYFLHTVTKGQGLYSISRMYGVTEADIISINPGSDVVIKVGEQLRIPQKKNQDTSSNEQQSTATGQQFHTIKTGETLYRLTVIYNMSAREICEANPGLSAENFKVGQVIVIPSKKVEQIETSKQQKVTEPAPLIGKSNNTVEATSTPQSDCRTEHLVQRKENIYRISRMYGITELELINANPELREHPAQTCFQTAGENRFAGECPPRQLGIDGERMGRTFAGDTVFRKHILPAQTSAGSVHVYH